MTLAHSQIGSNPRGLQLLPGDLPRSLANIRSWPNNKILREISFLLPFDTLSCSLTPILFLAVCGDSIEVGTRSSNHTSSAFVVADNFTSKSSSVGWHAELMSLLWDYVKDPILPPHK